MQASKCVLVLPCWCISNQTGGGQRTAIFYSALKQFGPTEVVVVGPAQQLQRAAIEVAFPGHAGLHMVETLRFPHRRLGRFELLAERLRRYVWFSHDYRADPAVRARIREILGPEPAVVVYRYFPTFCLAGHGPEDAARMHLCVDVDDRDDQKLLLQMRKMLPSPMILSLYQRTILPRLRRLMRHRLAIAAQVWFAAEEDFTDMAGLPSALISNVPFNSPPTGAVAPPSERHDILFVGSFAYAPNSDGVRWFLRHCWPQLRARHPESRLRIVGRGTWDRLAAEFPGVENVDFVGPVDELTAEYDRARLVVAPIFVGGGSKIKVIEACAFGRPVIVTSHSVRGFGREIEAALPRADSAEEFVGLCARYLDDAEAANALGGRLRELQQARFSRSAVEAAIAAQIRTGLTACDTRAAGDRQPSRAVTP